MKKKVVVKVKVSAAKSKKDSTVAVKTTRPGASKPVPKKPTSPADDPGYQHAVKDYEQAVKAMQGQKFDRAKVLLEKVVAAPVRELADRAAIHLNICNQQLSKATNTFKSPEEHYDYAISLMNMGDYVGCREHLEKLTNQYPKLDFVWYGRAVLDCLTGRFPEALQHLAESIRLNKNNRFQARNDSDFRNLADDPRFTELLYPEITGN
jgi:tetratricopeptide (TPR) repeat protein